MAALGKRGWVELTNSKWLFEVCTDFLVDNEADGAGWNNPREVWYEALVETLDTLVSEKEALVDELQIQKHTVKVPIPGSIPYFEIVDVTAKKIHIFECVYSQNIVHSTLHYIFVKNDSTNIHEWPNYFESHV